MLAPHFIRRNFEVKRLAQGRQQIGKESVLGDLGRPLAPPSHISLLCSVSVVVPRPPLPPRPLIRQLPRVPEWPLDDGGAWRPPQLPGPSIRVPGPRAPTTGFFSL